RRISISRAAWASTVRRATSSEGRNERSAKPGRRRRAGTGQGGKRRGEEGPVAPAVARSFGRRPAAEVPGAPDALLQPPVFRRDTVRRAAAHRQQAAAGPLRAGRRARRPDGQGGAPAAGADFSAG